MMSWAVFYFEPDQIAPQIGLAATSILTLIAFLFSLGKILSPIVYLTKKTSTSIRHWHLYF
jgi:hypothetical protein